MTTLHIRGNGSCCRRPSFTSPFPVAATCLEWRAMPLDLKELVRTRLGENYALHEQHLNSTLVAVQRIIGFDQVYTRAEGAYLYDRDGNAYLDFLSGYSVYNIGRNHPTVQQAIR